MVDNNGTLRKHTQYDTFGKITDEAYFDTAGDPIAAAHAEAIAQLFGYTGRPLDQYTGLQNNLHRWYDPTIGRWLSEDPIGFAAGDANLYRYVGNAATMWVDPGGLAPTTATWELAPALPKVPPGVGVAVRRAGVVGLVIEAGYGGYRIGEAIDNAGYNPFRPIGDWIGSLLNPPRPRLQRLPTIGHRPDVPPTTAPPGTLPIDVALPGRVHDIKPLLDDEGVGPGSWVGVAPNGDIIVTNPVTGEADVIGNVNEFPNSSRPGKPNRGKPGRDFPLRPGIDFIEN